MYVNNKKAGEVGEQMFDHLKSSKDTQNSLLAAGLAGANAKRQGKSSSEAALTSVIVGAGAKILGAAIRTLLKK